MRPRAARPYTVMILCCRLSSPEQRVEQEETLRGILLKIKKSKVRVVQILGLLLSVTNILCRCYAPHIKTPSTSNQLDTPNCLTGRSVLPPFAGYGYDVREILLMAHSMGMSGVGWAFLGHGIYPSSAYGAVYDPSLAAPSLSRTLALSLSFSHTHTHS